MRTCTSNIHHMFYSNNDPLPVKEFESKVGKICKHCAKCREYRAATSRKSRQKNGRPSRAKEPEISEYEFACLHCITPDGECIREDNHLTKSYDTKYLNRCMLAVARKFDVKEPRSIPRTDKIIKWQFLTGE